MKARQVPLVAIRAFSVTAQVGTVVRASEELSVTPGAVSRHIGNLEEWLGQKLFVREGRRLRLTPVGVLLAGRADQSIMELVSVCSELKGAPRRRQISIVSPATFGMQWLMPRIEAYERMEKDVEVWLTTRMANDRVDFFASDLVVARGVVADQQTALTEKTVLFYEMLTIVAAPEFIRQHNLSAPQDYLSRPRVSALSRPSDWLQWLAFAKLDDDATGIRRRFDHQFVAVHAAREGLGSLVAPGNLFYRDFTIPFPALTFCGQPYCIYSRGSEASFIRRFLDWLIEEGQRTASGRLR